MTRNRSVGFRAPEELHAYIARVAEARDVSKSDVVRESVRLARETEYFSMGPPPDDGSGRDDPPDDPSDPEALPESDVETTEEPLEETPAARVDPADRARQSSQESSPEGDDPPPTADRDHPHREVDDRGFLDRIFDR